jgi:twitching motility two-component system response regulator PilG
MQGQLSELDIRSILQLIELGQRTGELYVEAPYGLSLSGDLGIVKSPTSWVVFFWNGHIVYAGETSGRINRLQDYLQGYGIKPDIDLSIVSELAPFNSPEYAMLWALLEKHVLSPEQSRMILSNWVEETLFELLSLHHGIFVFRLGSALSPQLTAFEISPLVKKITQQVQEWHQLQPHIQSPQQFPVIVNAGNFESSSLRHRLKRFATLADGKTSIAQIARYLNRDLLSVAKGIYPYVKQGIMQVVPQGFPVQALQSEFEEQPWQLDRVPRIVCIDDGIAVRQTVERILDTHGYEVTSIANPLKALSLLFQLKPDLILCDISMPELEGYQLCAMVRQSVYFREVPIVMLTGRDGFIDRVKARMAGATDYLTKPFGENELITLVEKYVGQGDPERSQPESLLAQEIADVLEVGTSRAASNAAD